MKLCLLLVVVAAVCCCWAQTDPTYDHQTTTYSATVKPYSGAVSGSATVTPFFSPDTSIDVETQMIVEAEESVDIGTPGFSSWANCTQFDTPMVGCLPEVVRHGETFPIFQALLNALNRGVKVRILTNNYNIPCYPGKIDPLDFLTIAGAETRFYTTTTFLHTKYINVDGKKSAVSSVNYSYTSFMKNREAGMIFAGAGAQGVIDYIKSVYDEDWAQAGQWPLNTYNASALAIIKDTQAIPYSPPVHKSFPGSYVTTATPITVSSGQFGVIANPDYAYSTLSNDIASAQTSLDVYIYQITGTICNLLLDAQKRGVNIKLLVSYAIYDKPSWEAAQSCYKDLYYAGVTVRKTARDMYTYSHQKYYIRDGSVLWMSTGNFSPTDYPPGSSNEYPPFGQSGWRQANRDWTVKVTNSQVIDVFQTTLDKDYELGEDYYPDEHMEYPDRGPFCREK